MERHCNFEEYFGSQQENNKFRQKIVGYCINSPIPLISLLSTKGIPFCLMTALQNNSNVDKA
jgi:hypothetical protein